MDAREIGKAIKYLLFQNEDVKRMIGNNLFPFPATEGTSFPFVTYMMEGLTPRYTKDGTDFEDTIIIELNIWSDLYGKKIEVANACHRALQGKRGNIEGFEIAGIRRTGESELFVEETYGQSVTYEINIDNS
ncbi:MAG: hypothetical protein LBS55_02225 [Prevotellaceae bacterium]|jgi:hypothetical protein|nr:hypothetical protein [Prevotellaceae bacterium]